MPATAMRNGRVMLPQPVTPIRTDAAAFFVLAEAFFVLPTNITERFPVVNLYQEIPAYSLRC